MHEIRTTEGIVLSKRGSGEANSVTQLLTKELGLVRASARSTRVEVSKLRYALEPLTKAKFSLVHGKHEWRLVGAEDISHGLLGASVARRQAAGRISKLVSRLVQGEEPVQELFIAVSDGLESLALSQDDTDAQAIECVLVLRILSQLGYLPHTPELAPFVEDQIFSLELRAAAARSRTLLIKAINESLQHSGL